MSSLQITYPRICSLQDTSFNHVVSSFRVLSSPWGYSHHSLCLPDYKYSQLFFLFLFLSSSPFPVAFSSSPPPLLSFLHPLPLVLSCFFLFFLILFSFFFCLLSFVFVFYSVDFVPLAPLFRLLFYSVGSCPVGTSMMTSRSLSIVMTPSHWSPTVPQSDCVSLLFCWFCFAGSSVPFAQTWWHLALPLVDT